MVWAVLFDLDRTLLDFDRAQRGALGRALRGLGLPFSPRVLGTYRVINDALWAAYRRGEIAQAALEVERFRQLLLTLEANHRNARRLSRDFERYASTVVAFIRLAMIRIMLRRLAANASS